VRARRCRSYIRVSLRVSLARGAQVQEFNGKAQFVCSLSRWSAFCLYNGSPQARPPRTRGRRLARPVPAPAFPGPAPLPGARAASAGRRARRGRRRVRWSPTSIPARASRACRRRRRAAAHRPVLSRPWPGRQPQPVPARDPDRAAGHRLRPHLQGAPRRRTGRCESTPSAPEPTGCCRCRKAARGLPARLRPSQQGTPVPEPGRRAASGLAARTQAAGAQEPARVRCRAAPPAGRRDRRAQGSDGKAVHHSHPDPDPVRRCCPWRCRHSRGTRRCRRTRCTRRCTSGTAPTRGPSRAGARPGLGLGSNAASAGRGPPRQAVLRHCRTVGRDARPPCCAARLRSASCTAGAPDRRGST
jgi:hypothetical protein